MKFTSESISHNATVHSFTLTKEEGQPVLIYLIIIAFSLLGYTFNQPIFLLIIVIWVSIWRQATTQETLCVIKDLGIQITKISRAGGKKNFFVDCSQIREIVINEGLTPYSVVVYIAIILYNAKELIIPFEDFRISLVQAQEIYNGVRSLLYE